MKRTTLTCLVILFSGFSLLAQDIAYAKYLIDSLCSPGMYGRGYVNGGMARAAVFLSTEMEKLGLEKETDDYLQGFPISVNTFPGEITVRINDTTLLPGMHYIVAPYSPPVYGSYHLLYPDTLTLMEKGADYQVQDTNDVVVFPAFDRKNKVLRTLADSLRRGNPFGGAGVIQLKEKIHWYVSHSVPVRDYFMIEAADSIWLDEPDSLHIVIRSVEEPWFRVENVFGYVKGTEDPDKFVLFTAHYDHLGMMGNHAMFPGAHDNASGTALIMDLARHYAANPPGHSVAFLACAAEESGLHGSFHFVKNPLLPLGNVDMVINLDLVGSGSEGIHIVNGKTWPAELERLRAINDTTGLVADISAGGESANSDHYPFHAAGIPAIFIFTRGQEYREYHTLSDRAEKVPLTAYNELYRLLIKYTEALMEDER